MTTQRTEDGMSTRPVSARPVPVPDELSVPFWEAAARHELALQGCAECETLRHPPRHRCPSCGSCDPGVWRVVDGSLRLRSWTTVHADVLPGTPPPFTVGQAGLDSEPHVEIVADIAADDPRDLRIGQAMTAGYLDLQSPDGIPFTLLQLRPEADR